MDACKTTCRRSGPLAVFALLLAWPLASPAVQPPVVSGHVEAQATAIDPAAVPLGRAVTEDALSQLRGGDYAVVVSVDNSGSVTGNSATHVISGDNRIGEGAFANASGLPMVIQNSGSNVLIQNGTSINVQFGEPGR